MAETHSVPEKMRLSEPTTKNEDRLILSGQKCRPLSLVSGDISLCGYSQGFSGEGASNDSGVIENVDFHGF